MRYDLVVNTMFKTAFTERLLTLHNGGAIWRPMIHIKDAAMAYSKALNVIPEQNFTIYNISSENYRISEVALHIKDALKKHGVETDLKLDYSNRAIRNYRVSNKKMLSELFKPQYSIRDAVDELVEKAPKDFDNPIYYNIQWLLLLEKAKAILGIRNGSVF